MRRFLAARSTGFSLRGRLVWQFVALSLVLVVALFFAVRLAAERASRASQDAVLGAAVIAVADAIRPVDDGLAFDLPYAAFSMLGAMGNERIFYSLSIGPRHVSGYEDLPSPPTHTSIRGALDTQGVKKRKQGRSKYGTKRQKAA